ncbi:MAG: CPBP family intramembrane metalloprotease [Bacteroidales bacterium]|nr:CPBP family intramembrane metalloprotease [Bacteroidales bacterium]
MDANKHQRFELLAILISGILKFIVMDYMEIRAFYIVGICIFWVSYIYYRYSSDNAILNYWGFKREYFRQSIVILLPLIIVSIIVTLVYGVYNDTIILSWHILPVLCLYPVWGIFQQYLMLALITHNISSLMNINVTKTVIVLLTSTIFCLVHYPNFFLMIFTFFMEAIFIIVYMKWKNLWALGIAHGWIATFLLYYVLGRDLWAELLILY